MIIRGVMDRKSLIDEFITAYNELRVFAMTLEHNENDALDLMQDLAEILLVKGDELHDVRVPIAYFRTCLRHLKYNKITKNAKESVVDPVDIDILNSNSQEDFGISCIEILGWLKSQLASSPPELREAFIKYHIDGHPLEQVAKDLNMATNTLSQKFSRMRRKLKQESSVLYMAFLMLILNQTK